jgi:SSS family solute:Na+ symporter
MVSGLFVPTLGAYLWPRGSSRGALWAMLAGGSLTLVLSIGWLSLPEGLAAVALDPAFYGLALSAATYVVVSLATPDRVESGAGIHHV